MERGKGEKDAGNSERVNGGRESGRCKKEKREGRKRDGKAEDRKRRGEETAVDAVGSAAREPTPEARQASTEDRDR